MHLGLIELLYPGPLQLHSEMSTQALTVNYIYSWWVRLGFRYYYSFSKKEMSNVKWLGDAVGCNLFTINLEAELNAAVQNYFKLVQSCLSILLCSTQHGVRVKRTRALYYSSSASSIIIRDGENFTS